MGFQIGRGSRSNRTFLGGKMVPRDRNLYEILSSRKTKKGKERER